MSSRKKEPENPVAFSETIASFNRMVDSVKKDYKWHTENVQKMDQLTQDYLHKLELDNPDYRERAKIATALQKCRIERRKSKDITDKLRPMIMYLNDKRGVEMMKSLSETLGKTRIIEECFERRIYVPRVLENDSGLTSSKTNT